MQISQPADKICPESEIFEQILSLDGKEILELGCGNADLTRLIATSGHDRKITATEVDEAQHAKNMSIHDLSNVTFIEAGSEALPFPDESFDVVLMFKSLHHVPLDLMGKALSETKRVLKPGGLAYISEPVFEGDFNEVLRLFHDEQAVRQAAFEAVKQCVDNQELVLADEIFFNTPTVFKDFDDYENRVINVTHSSHRLSPEQYTRVREQFSLNMQDDGASFLIPIRVDLLQKKD